MNENLDVNLTQTYGDHCLRFTGPDLLDYVIFFDIKGGDFDGERLKIESAHHPCCGTLEVNAGLLRIYKRWRNKLDGCTQHRRDGGGDRTIRDFVWEIDLDYCHDQDKFLLLLQQDAPRISLIFMFLPGFSQIIINEIISAFCYN